MKTFKAALGSLFYFHPGSSQLTTSTQNITKIRVLKRSIAMVENMNEQLTPLYNEYLAFLKDLSIELRQNMSYPLLMTVHPEYAEVPRKVLYVGKETYTWVNTLDQDQDQELSVEYLRRRYTDFAFAKNYHGRNSPFWRFVYSCHNQLNGESVPSGLLWTNISKCDSGGTTPARELQDINKPGFDLLIKEIEVVKPDVVLFLTGWSYDHHIQRIFQGIEYDTIEDNYLYRCKHRQLPEHTFQTMHPNGLNFRKKLNTIFEKIIELV